MSTQKKYFYFAIALLVIPIITAAFKYQSQHGTLQDVTPKSVFQVTYEFDLFNLPDSALVKAYLPQSNERQIIRTFDSSNDSLDFQITNVSSGKLGTWKFNNQWDALRSYQFEVESKSIAYTLPEGAAFETEMSDSLFEFLQATEYIQSNHDSILSTAQGLKAENLYATLQNNFEFVKQVENSTTGVLTDAWTTLRRNRGSCNGQSRLFVALCRAQGIPARVVGGIVLEDVQKRTSHLWAEVYYRGYWMPFDALNNHFIKLPAHFLELYKGDKFLITHTKGIGFDYQFNIQKQYQSSLVATKQKASLWSLASMTGISLDLLRGILLLPLAALIVAIFRNVIGLKTFGIFLPALIGLSLVKVNLLWGLIAFGAVILVVSLLHYPLEKLGLLHTPKLVFMLTVVVLTLLGISLFGMKNNWIPLTTAMFLPVIILAITAERFAKILIEDKLEDALKMLGSTFFIAFLCYPIFNADLLLGVFLTYPEFYLSILGIMIFLGRWIGLRVTEYFRFTSFSV